MKAKYLFRNMILFIGLLWLCCNDLPFESPQPGRLVLYLKLNSGPYASIILPTDRLDVVIQYVKGYVDEQRWSYIVDKDSFKVVNLLKVDQEGNILAPTATSAPPDSTTASHPVILSDCNGVYLPPFTYKNLQIKIVLQDTTFSLGGIRYRLFQNELANMIVDVPLNVEIQENQWIERIIYFNLPKSLERSTAEPDLFYFKPQFYIE